VTSHVRLILAAGALLALILTGGFSLARDGGSYGQARRGPVTSLGIRGDRFTLNGTETFLLGVSYFDIKNWRVSDLDGFASRQFNLVRVWLDWLPDVAPDRSMFDQSNGTISPSNQTVILAFVRACASRGIVVDVTILQDGTRMAVQETAVRHAVSLLRKEANVMFDVVNEHNNRLWSHDHRGMMTRLITAAKQAGPQNIIYYSSWEKHHLSEDPAVPQRGVINDELNSGVMALTPHLLRTPDWFSQTTSRVMALKTYLSSIQRVRPIYLQEENRRGGNYINSSAEEFRTAAQNARNAGAAGWVFHTQAGFDLSTQDFFARLDAIEREVMETLAGAIAARS
jgi:hypothetical protein